MATVCEAGPVAERAFAIRSNWIVWPHGRNSLVGGGAGQCFRLEPG